MPPKKRKSVRQGDSVQANSAVRDQVVAMFDDGSINANTSFDDIYDEYPSFHVVKREKFRRWFNTQKRLRITLSKFCTPSLRNILIFLEAMGAPAANQLGTSNVTESAEAVPDDSKLDEDIILEDEDNKSELSESVLTWQPLYAVAPWRDPVTKEDYISAAVVLPTGVGEQANDIIVRIEDGKKLRVGVAWPLALADSERLNRKWITGSGVPQIEAYHPRVMAFANFVEKYQAHEGERIISWATIDLPNAVKPDFEKHTFGFKDSKTIVVYVDMMSPERNFAKKREEFKIEIN